ncbi:MAG: hypothetical protein JWO80_5242 [Bryobacterales bacterium]|nr:hypothetical protein [Bryobacterales bacterium]
MAGHQHALDGQNGRQKREVQWENAQRSSKVEGPEVVSLVSGIEENAGDQEP